MTRKPFTDEHKQAMSIGISQTKTIRAYLTQIQSDTPVRRTRPSAEIQAQLAAATDPIERLRLRPLLREALEVESENSIGLTAQFIKICANYSERLGLTYADWREEGVPAAVLKEAGLRG